MELVVDLPEAAHAAAWAQWDSSGEAAAWEVTVGDGMTDTPH